MLDNIRCDLDDDRSLHPTTLAIVLLLFFGTVFHSYLDQKYIKMLSDMGWDTVSVARKVLSPPA